MRERELEDIAAYTGRKAIINTKGTRLKGRRLTLQDAKRKVCEKTGTHSDFDLRNMGPSIVLRRKQDEAHW